jgi:hypothetical protein
MTEAGWSRFFAVAAGFNLIVGVSLLLAPMATTAALGLAPLADEVVPRLLGWTIAILGAAYAMVSRNLRLREIVWLGLVGKTGTWVLFLHGWLQGAVPAPAMLAGSGDLVLALGFAVFLFGGARRR